MLVLAGKTDGVIDTIEKYDLNSETWTKTSWKTPTAEGSSCAVSINSTKVMFLGGSSGGMGRRKAHILDLTDGSWTSLPDAPSDMKNSGCSTGSYQGNKGVFVSGGVGAETLSKFFDLTDQQWKTLPNHNVNIKEGLYNPGGVWGDNPVVVALDGTDMEQFDGESWVALSTRSQFEARMASAVTTVPEWFAHWLLSGDHIDWAGESKCTRDIGRFPLNDIFALFLKFQE